MPSSIVKLSAYDARAWSANAPSWLEPDGSVAGPVTREEQQAISRVLEKSMKVQTSFRQTVPLLPLKKNQQRRNPQQARNAPLVEFAFEISFVGNKRVVTVFKGDLRYVRGRDLLSARLLSEHGECVLHGRNGKCIGVLRDPFVQSRAPNQGRRVQWSRGRAPEAPQVADHRDIAQSAPRPKKRMPLVRRAVMPVAPDAAPIPERLSPPVSVTATVAPQRRRVQSVPAPAARIEPAAAAIAPSECPHDCRGLVKGGAGWSLAESAPQPGPDQHHPFCPHSPAWEEARQPNRDEELVLYDIELATIMRPADPSEIEAARESEARTQMPNVTVQERIYSVLPRKFAEQAAAEARGEVADESELGEETSDEPDTADLSEVDEHEAETLVPGSVSSESSEERSEWPTLDALQRRGGDYRTNAEITARDYLTRKTGTPASP